MTRSAAVLLAALLIGCGHRVPPPHSPAPASAPVPPGRTVWVDAFSPAGGDGTAAHPWRRLEEAWATVERPLRVELRPGLYAGPVQLEGAVTLHGPATAVLHGEGPVVVSLGAGAALEGVSVQGGAIGITLLGPAALRGVRLSGQRVTAVDVRDGAVELSGCVLEASVSETVGLMVRGDARARVTELTVRGPFRRGVEVEDSAALDLRGARFQNAVTAVYARGSMLEVHDLASEGGRGPGLFAAHSAVRLFHLRFRGHEYGVETREVHDLRIVDLGSEHPERAGLALVQSSGRVEDLTVSDAGESGGLDLVHSEVTVSRFHIDRPRSYGVHVREGSVTLSGGIIRGVHEPGGRDGDGLELRATRATVRDVQVLGAGGVGVLAAEQSEVDLAGVTLEDCSAAGLFVDTGARVHGSGLVVRRSGGAAIVVPGEGSVRLQGLLSAEMHDGPVFAECREGARVELLDARSDVEVPRSECVSSR